MTNDVSDLRSLHRARVEFHGGEGYVDSWNQDERHFDGIRYIPLNEWNGFVRINQTLVGNEDRSFRDDSTEPGVQ